MMCRSLEIARILDYCRKMTELKRDFVVIGSTSYLLHGLIDRVPNDIDLLVEDLSGLEGSISTYITDSKHSESGKRAIIFRNDTPKIDIFVENYTPASQIIEGIRVRTIPASLYYYENLLPKVAELWKGEISDKINMLRYGKQRK